MDPRTTIFTHTHTQYKTRIDRTFGMEVKCSFRLETDFPYLFSVILLNGKDLIIIRLEFQIDKMLCVMRYAPYDICIALIINKLT